MRYLGRDACQLSRGLIILLAVAAGVFWIGANIVVLWSDSAKDVLYAEWLPSAANGTSTQRVGSHVWRKAREPAVPVAVQVEHPVRDLMNDADYWFMQYDEHRSRTFSETVAKYRRKYGRHPPPHFKEWYKFARRRKVHNIDEFFDQVNDDIRPFWGIEPAVIRNFAAHASDDRGHFVATVSLRQGQVFQELWGWRSETFIKMLAKVSQWLPDMDIPINRMDQPRVIVPWEVLQNYLTTEQRTRSLSLEGVRDSFTANMSGLWRRKPQKPAWYSSWNPFWYPEEHQIDDAEPPPDYGWFSYGGRQYMDLAAPACPPESYARNTDSATHFGNAEASYKHELGGLVTNFNLSSDLCTVGPQLSHSHGMLFASTSTTATRTLVPIFGECKLNVNNDILFPANMYYKLDRRYNYNDAQDINWDDKDDTAPWRGETSGGLAFENQPEAWHDMHRQRLVQMTNSTLLSHDPYTDTASILALTNSTHQTYEPAPFHPASFAAEYTDIGFTGKISCLPTCDFYDRAFAMLPRTPFSENFKSKFLIDVDGHSFSGRWRAFLQSRSLGFKATIFREWHDSRLWAWKHFVPVDNRFDDLWTLLTYFVGLKREKGGPEVARHDFEAFKLAEEGRRWAAKVLRREDMEIYLFRLLLEYGRVIDDDRDQIGVVGDGGKEMEEFDQEVPAIW